MFSVVDNMWRGEGFAFVIEDQAHSDRWKNNQHGDFATREEAETVARNLNLLWEV